MWLTEGELQEVSDGVEKTDGFVCKKCGKKAYSDVLIDHMAERFKEIETAFSTFTNPGTRVSRVHLKAKDYAELRKYARESLDLETQVAVLKTGVMARMWGAELVVSRVFPKGYLLLTEAEVYLA
jgi:hypothetical protein